MSEWMNNSSSDGSWLGDKFASREEAIADGVRQHAKALSGYGTMLFDEYDDDGRIPSVFYVGRVIEWHPFASGSYLIEQAQEDAWDAAGEYGEDYLCDVTKEQADELDELVRQVFDGWLKRHHLEPTFYAITETEEIRVQGSEEK